MLSMAVDTYFQYKDSSIDSCCNSSNSDKLTPIIATTMGIAYLSQADKNQFPFASIKASSIATTNECQAIFKNSLAM